MNNSENRAQEEFDEKYITTTGIMEYLDVNRSTVHYARVNGRLPEPISVHGQIYIWERSSVDPYLAAWKSLLDTRRGA